MIAVQKLLVYVLCALLALGTAPRSIDRCGAAAPAVASDAASPPARSCCAPGACCCGGGSDCGAAACKGPERRAPSPRLPAGKPVQVALPAPAPLPPRPVRDGDDGGERRAAASAAAPRAFRALPARLRQEALSVWRC
jgi:hypothetical protein